MISSEESDPSFEPDFEDEEHEECLNAVEPSIYEVSHEEIGDVWRFSSDFK